MGKTTTRERQMKKKSAAGPAGSRISALWNKAQKKDETSTPNQSVVESSGSHDQLENNLQLVLWQKPDDEHEPERNATNPAPIVEDGVSTDEDDEATEVDLQALKHDPGKRIPISRYDVNDQDRVRRRFIEMGPCQPKKHKFKVTVKGGKDRRFILAWFNEFPWIEYSVEKDAAFCFVCFLFKDKTKCPGGDSFVKNGFRNWNMKPRLARHEGGIGSAHGEAQEKFDLFCTPKASIQASLASNNSRYKALYLQRLTWTLKCLRYLLHQGLAFRGHDESEDSLNKGNFLELLNWLAGNFEEVNKVVLNNAPQNCRMIHHDIQHELIKCCARETTKLLIEELDGGHFAILADESSDVYQNEQLAVCLRYVDKKGGVVVRLLGLAHVEDTTSLTLKAAIQQMLMEYNLTFAMARGQGYDGASNIVQLSVMLVETNMAAQYFIVYKLLKLVLILPVATASVERVFSSMNYLKNKLRNKMGDDYLNNCMVTFVERELFNQVKDEDVINLFQKGNRKVIL